MGERIVSAGVGMKGAIEGVEEVEQERKGEGEQQRQIGLLQ